MLLDAEVPNSASPYFFDQFLVFRLILVQVKLNLLMTKPTVRMRPNKLRFLRKGKDIFEKGSFTLNSLALATKGSQDCTPNHF